MKEKDIRELFHKITEKLIEKGLTVTTMESCTSGQIASLITDTEGSSAVLKGAFITYSNEAKIALGVDEDVIRKYSVYSLETAKEMAEKCRRFFKADIGIGITGTFSNPDPLNMDHSHPGEVYFALSFKTETKVFFQELTPEEDRYHDKLKASFYVGTQLLKVLG